MGSRLRLLSLSGQVRKAVAQLLWEVKYAYLNLKEVERCELSTREG